MCMGANSLQLCLTFCNPMDCSPSGSSSMGFSRQQYWSGLPCSPPGDLPDPEIKPTSPVSPGFQADSSPLSYRGKPQEVAGAGKRAGESGGRTAEGASSDFNLMSLGWEPQGALCPGQFKMWVWSGRSLVVARGRRGRDKELRSNRS